MKWRIRPNQEKDQGRKWKCSSGLVSAERAEGQALVRAHRGDWNTSGSSGPPSVFREDTVNFKGSWSRLWCQLWNPTSPCPRWPWSNLHDSICSVKKRDGEREMLHVGGWWSFHLGIACLWSAWLQEEKPKLHTRSRRMHQIIRKLSYQERVFGVCAVFLRSLASDALEHFEYFSFLKLRTWISWPWLYEHVLKECKCVSEVAVVFRAASQCAVFCTKGI